MGDGERWVASRWTGPLQWLVVAASAVFVAGTALQTFVIIDERAITGMMRLAGAPVSDAPAFLAGFRLVGCLYIVGNAIGLLARTGRAWVFWTVLLVNVTQAAGVVAVPPEVFEVTRDRFGAVGLVPSWGTDGGALALSVVLLATLARYRRPWARLPRHAG